MDTPQVLGALLMGGHVAGTIRKGELAKKACATRCVGRAMGAMGAL